MNRMAEQVSNLVNRVGSSITYKRVTGETYNATTGINAVTYTDYALRASVRDYSPRELMGEIRIGDKKVTIAGHDISFVPAKDDNIVIGGLTYNVVGVDTRSISDDAGLQILQVRGAGA